MRETRANAYSYASGTNRLSGVTTDGTPSRSFSSDDAGNVIGDTDLSTGTTKALVYNHPGQLSTFKVGGVDQGVYTHDYRSLLASRELPGSSTTLHYVHDLDGNVIAEYDSAGTLQREYVWLDDRPVAAIEAGTPPVVYFVHTDHLQRPVMMTDAGANIVWRASYLPYGEVYSITGPASLDYRFPGQWFQLESGLNYNWHRHYDTTTGRYTEPDPLGLHAGINRWAYVGNSPLMEVDPEGLAQPPANAWWPEGPKAPGHPGDYPYLNGPLQWPGDPRGGPNWVENPNPGRGGAPYGWEDRLGNVWCPTGPGPRAEGQPHWDVQLYRGKGKYENVYPPAQQPNPPPILRFVPPQPSYWLPILITIGLGIGTLAF